VLKVRGSQSRFTAAMTITAREGRRGGRGRSTIGCRQMGKREATDCPPPTWKRDSAPPVECLDHENGNFGHDAGGEPGADGAGTGGAGGEPGLEAGQVDAPLPRRARDYKNCDCYELGNV
jgi:hypothetical protein